MRFLLPVVGTAFVIACATGCGAQDEEAPPDSVTSAVDPTYLQGDGFAHLSASFSCTTGYDFNEQPIQTPWMLSVAVRQKYGTFEARTGPDHFNPWTGYMDTIAGYTPDFTFSTNNATLVCNPDSVKMFDTVAGGWHVLYNSVPMPCQVVIHDQFRPLDQPYRSVPVTIPVAGWQMLALTPQGQFGFSWTLDLPVSIGLGCPADILLSLPITPCPTCS